MDERSITLADGRALGYHALGDAGGRPLLFFHGTPGSRLALSRDDHLARIPGLRLIVVERPGYGISDPRPERTLLDWADDVVELADALGLGSFAVAGESGGGPHALACGHRLPRRVTSVLLFASAAPAGARRGMSLGNRLALLVGRFLPGLVRWTIRAQAAAFERDPERFVDAMAAQMGEPDRALLADDAFRAAILRDLREAYRQGGDAQADDGLLVMAARPWGFEPAEIAIPVHLWHGTEDRLVPVAMAEELARALPRCDARFLPGAGHLLTEHPEVIATVEKLTREGIL